MCCSGVKGCKVYGIREARFPIYSENEKMLVAVCSKQGTKEQGRGEGTRK